KRSVVRGRARTIVRVHGAQRAGRPQLKRDPLGGSRPNQSGGTMSAHTCAVRRSCTATLLLVTLQGTACQAWHTEDVVPQAVLATHQPSQLRITRTDGQQLVLQHPVLRGDTV